MNLAIVINKVSWEEKEIIKAARSKGAKVETINNQRIFFDLEKNDLKADIILQRSLSYFRGLYSTAILENQGYTVVNNTECTRICGDKLYTSLKLIKHGIPVVKTYCAFTKEAALEALEKLGYPAIIKPIVGSWGRLVALLSDRNAAIAVLEDRETLGGVFHKIFYLQEYVKKPARKRREFTSRRSVARDIRVIVIGGQVIEAMYRYDTGDDWRSSATKGAKTDTCRITPEIEELALKAANAVDGEILGIDLMEDSEENLLVQEINHTSGFRMLSLTTGRDIAGAIVDYLKERCKK
ncbi:MAG: lysine biosynthesis protein LysX [Candidatus Helarchaeota archaeon]